MAAADGIPTAVRSHKDFASRGAFDAHIQSVLDGWGAEIVCLAGFMRIFSTGFAERWTGRMLNIHPSLLPLYKGLDTHQRAINAGDRFGGCSVHVVTPALDDGPVLAQTPLVVGESWVLRGADPSQPGSWPRRVTPEQAASDLHGSVTTAADYCDTARAHAG